MAFRKDMIWGASTASYQIEGAWNEDGKGLNIWDVYTHQPGHIYAGHTGDVGPDHYHHFKEDVQIMKQLGLKAYRFSISWARILPNGTGRVEERGVKFYSDLIDELLANGIEPFITLFHWDLPYALHRKGGWLNDDMVQWFSDYAKLIVERFSDRVTHFMTINEPIGTIASSYADGRLAPGLKSPFRDVLQMAHILLQSHGAAVKAMRKAAKQPIQIGIAPSGNFGYPATDTPEDIEAARKFSFACKPIEQACRGISWWEDPIYLGKYPDDGLEMYKDYLPEITEADMELIHQPLDFMAQNIYDGFKIRAGKNGEPEIVPPEVGNPRNAINWPLTPETLQWGTRFLSERYGNLPIYVTENGLSTHDVVSLDGQVHDPNRIDFLQRNLMELEKAADAGVNIRGYFHWSLMDNMEWHMGYRERIGFVHFDYQTGERRIKDSGHWYKQFIESVTAADKEA